MMEIRKGREACAGMTRGRFEFRGQGKDQRSKSYTENAEVTEGTEKRGQRRAKGNEDSARGEREDEEIAFAGYGDGEGAAVGGDGEIAEAEAVEDGDGHGLRDGNFMVRGDRRERRKIDPDAIGGFLFEGALKEDARFVGRPAKDAEADAKTGHAIE